MSIKGAVGLQGHGKTYETVKFAIVPAVAKSFNPRPSLLTGESLHMQIADLPSKKVHVARTCMLTLTAIRGEGDGFFAFTNKSKG